MRYIGGGFNQPNLSRRRAERIYRGPMSAFDARPTFHTLGIRKPAGPFATFSSKQIETRHRAKAAHKGCSIKCDRDKKVFKLDGAEKSHVAKKPRWREAQNIAQTSVPISDQRKAALASVRMAQNVDQTMPKHARSGPNLVQLLDLSHLE
jgi:hypothetical protein